MLSVLNGPGGTAGGTTPTLDRSNVTSLLEKLYQPDQLPHSERMLMPCWFCTSKVVSLVESSTCIPPQNTLMLWEILPVRVFHVRSTPSMVSSGMTLYCSDGSSIHG